MNPESFYKFLPLVFCFLLSSCRFSPNSNPTSSPPLVFNSLNLRSQKQSGVMDWSLKSPKARYQHGIRLIKAIDPSGIIYQDDKPYISIKAKLATIINDGEILLLEGEVRLKQLTNNKAVILGKSMKWTPSNSLIVIEHRPTLHIPYE
ncbi:LPS export ABC transporter periplasmic protein LptC [Prochlorococcus sp. MIT 1300]|uniref:LPS export ABC transporter periplasmic protein LptC n=1 Tax=Prochlorococcus sp. MIT 1300 TaxID=3096218 RepID=UPI002A751796|nr:LPS export ABC transporter periplasmic protein LptC [Prochlorococcus sp. MIT 1300]